MSLDRVLSGEQPWIVIHSDCLEILPTIGEVDCAIFDPPYSRRVHENAQTSRRNSLPDTAEFSCRTKRRLDLGFEHLRPHVRRAIAQWCGGHVRRWSIAFSDTESAWLWQLSFTAAGLNFRRTGEWERIGGAPQFNGMEPAAGSESIIICHRKGRRHWNGGGKPARYSFPIVANRLGQRGSRVHPTQKPLDLMQALVLDFTDPGDLVVDPLCGSGTTGVACLRLGRRFIGIEQNEEHATTARERLEAEERGLTLVDARAGQTSIFDRVGGSR